MIGFGKQHIIIQNRAQRTAPCPQGAVSLYKKSATPIVN